MSSLRDLCKLVALNDFSIPTWLAFGASFQLVGQSWLPSGWAYWVPILYLVYLVVRVAIDSRRIFPGSFANVRHGKWTATLPEQEPENMTASSDGVVMFMLGVRFNHPLGKLAPGMKELGTVFEDMWKEAERNREKWSYLGRSHGLLDASDKEGTTMFYLSYWRDLKGLQQFSACSAHRVGMVGYVKQKFPHAGIMHETYHSPKGHWETIYDNMPPTGFGRANCIVGKESDEFKLGETLKPSPSKSTMFSRMGWDKTRG